MTDDLRLEVRRTIAATPQRLFAAWTDPDQLVRWWGPKHVTCTEAQIDLRVGGAYRLANRLPDGTVLHIVGTFETIDPPRTLVYSWRLEGRDDPPERVTVRFEPRPSGTEVVVVHERIRDRAVYEDHETGWYGCLDGLADLVNSSH